MAVSIPSSSIQITDSGFADACGASEGPRSCARQRAPSNSNVEHACVVGGAGLDADDHAVGREHLPDRVAPLDDGHAGPVDELLEAEVVQLLDPVEAVDVDVRDRQTALRTPARS